VLEADRVLQLGAKVVKPYDEQDYNQRFKGLESQISELRSFLLLNESTSFHKNKKEDELNGLGRIRTGDLRRVKTEALALAPLFLDRSEVFLDTFADDTTTRNASAPSCTV
jgi:hypothetical protein